MRTRIALKTAVSAVLITSIPTITLTSDIVTAGADPARTGPAAVHPRHGRPASPGAPPGAAASAAPVPLAPLVPLAAVLPPPPPPPTDATSTSTGDWQCIRVRESGDAYNDPTRPSGAYGILLETWRSFGYSGWPYEASAGVQDGLALTLFNRYGWQPWSTRFACGLG